MLWNKEGNQPPAQPNPYLDARREWNAQMGSVAASANNWRLMALASTCVALVSVVGLVTLGASKEVVPYVVVLDETGSLVSSGTPQSQTTTLDERVVKALIGSFIANFRTVTADGTAQHALIQRLYNTLSAGDPAYRAIKEYLTSDGDPFSRARDELVAVQLSSILALSALSYQVEWTETVRSRDGKVLRKPQFQAVLTLRQVEGLSGAQRIDNPIGLFIEDIKWTKRL